MTHRQPKLSPALRIVAAGCIVLWLLASSCCNIEFLCSGDHHTEADASKALAHHNGGLSAEAEVAEHALAEASHPHDSEQPSNDSHPHDSGDNSCCSTLMATAQFATPFVIIKPVLQPLDFLCSVLQARDLMLSAPKDEQKRQAKPSDWVFTPQVCLGAAHRSLAPPSLA